MTTKFLIGNIKIYYINLDKSINRKLRIEKLFNDNNIVNYTRINAIDGNNINVSDYNCADGVTPYELACTLSHIKAIKQAYDDECEIALILEDDANFDYFEYKTIPILDLFKQNPNCHILQLSISGRNDYNENIALKTNDLFEGRKDCAAAYLIDRRGMRKLLVRTDPYDKSDKYIYNTKNIFYTKPYFSYYYSDEVKSCIQHQTTYKREDESKKFWDNYYLYNKKKQHYDAIFLIIDSDNLDCYDFNRIVWRNYIKNHKNVLALFIKFKNIESNYLLDGDTLFIKGEEIFTGAKILEKTIKGFKYCFLNYTFDWMVRTNLSTFWKINSLINFLKCRQKNTIYGWMVNKNNMSFISGTGIIIPYQLLQLTFDHNSCETNCDDMEITSIYRSNEIYIKDARRFDHNYVFKFEENNIDNIIERFKYINGNEICFRVKNITKREIYDKYVLNKLLQMYYNINLLKTDNDLLLQKLIKINDLDTIKIFLSKKVFSYNIKFINKLLTNKNYVITNDISICDVLITNVCERQDYFNEKSLNVIISGEKKTSKNTYDISLSTIYDFNSSIKYYFPYGYMSLNEHIKSIDNKDYTNTKEKFCAYMYSVDNQNRINYFNLLSTYKRVDALGKSCKNVDILDTRFVNNNTENFNDIAVDLYTKYKFVLALENDFKAGYMTEKLINPLIANSLPIYWGHPDAFNFINKKRVIYIQDFESDSKLLEYISFLDNNDEKYQEIINEPIYINNMNPVNVENNIINNFFNI